MCKLLNDQLIKARGKRYRVERWQGENPHYIFNSIEEEYSDPIEKTLKEVELLIKTNTIVILQ